MGGGGRVRGGLGEVGGKIVVMGGGGGGGEFKGYLGEVSGIVVVMGGGGVALPQPSTTNVRLRRESTEEQHGLSLALLSPPARGESLDEGRLARESL